MAYGRPGRKPVPTRLVLEAVLWILNMQPTTTTKCVWLSCVSTEGKPENPSAIALTTAIHWMSNCAATFPDDCAAPFKPAANLRAVDLDANPNPAFLDIWATQSHRPKGLKASVHSGSWNFGLRGQPACPLRLDCSRSISKTKGCNGSKCN